jgi:hypothetical protein
VDYRVKGAIEINDTEPYQCRFCMSGEGDYCLLQNNWEKCEAKEIGDINCPLIPWNSQEDNDE